MRPLLDPCRSPGFDRRAFLAACIAALGGCGPRRDHADPDYWYNVVQALRGHLTIMSQEVDAAGLTWVLDRPAFPTLEDLNLIDNAIDVAALEVILTHPKTQALEMLNLSFNPLGDEGLRRLARWPGLDPVDWLGLNAAGMTSSGVAALAEAAQERSWLTIGNNRLGPTSTDALCLLAPGVLVVEDSDLDARSAVRLVTATRATALELGQNPIGDDLDGLEAASRASISRGVVWVLMRRKRSLPRGLRLSEAWSSRTP